MTNREENTKKELFAVYQRIFDTAGKLQGLLTEMMDTGISGMMDAQPNPVAGASAIKKQRKGTQKRGQLGYKYVKIRTATMN